VPFERLAANLSQLGQSAQAETEMRRAVEIADRTLPETQLGRPFAHQLLANLLQYAGHYDEALTEITGALAGFAKIMGVRSQHYGGALSVRGEIMNQLGRYREAEALLARACEIVAFTSGDDSAYYARCEGRHCTALAGLGRDAEVLPRADHIVAILDKIHDAPSPEVADAFVRRGTAHAALHHHRAAIADLERAVAIAQNVRSEPGILASAQWRLGKELWTDQPQRARAQLAAALALFETTDASWSGERREAAAWLASHSPSRGRAR
jgi:tetratricopeptide (TPR) repeat protein